MNTLTLPIASIEQFISQANKFSMLAPEREHELATRFIENDDLDAAQELIMSHLRLVIAIARDYLGYGLPHADLIQEGSIGLMKAVKRFDPYRGVRLATFATYWIKSEIQEYVLNNWRMIKSASTKAQRKLFFNLRKFKKNAMGLGETDVKLIADALDVKPTDVREMELRLYGSDVPLLGEADEEGPIDFLKAEGADPLEHVIERQQELRGASVKNALTELDARSARIIEARWMTSPPLTLSQLSSEFGVSQERIRQVEVKALKHLRAKLSHLA